MASSPTPEERLSFLEDGHDHVSRASSVTAFELDDQNADDDIDAMHKQLLYSPSYHGSGSRPLTPQGRLASALISSFRRPRVPQRHLFRRTRFTLLRRQPFATLLRLVRWIVYTALFLLVATPILAPSYTRPPVHYRELVSRCQSASAEPGCANPFNERVFISVSLFDRQGRLAAGHWGRSLLELVHLLGERNVFVSIYENDSGPEGAAALAALKARLRCRHEVVSDPHVSLDDFPTVTMPDGSQRLKRLTYLSEMRNRALRPLDRLDPPGESDFDEAETPYGSSSFSHSSSRSSPSSSSSSASRRRIQPFDKVLFLNDVAFHPTDAAQLLFSTNVGADGRARYLATCALDFANPFLFYDLYAQRDFEGYSNGVPIFPFFSGAGRGVSRADMLAQRDAVRVSSCWGGMVAVQARWLQNLNETGALPEPGFGTLGHAVVDPRSPRNVTSPVRFRHEPEIFYDACECCLLLADISTVARKAHVDGRPDRPGLDGGGGTGNNAARRGGAAALGGTAAMMAADDDDSSTQVFVNPYVRVAYDPATLAWLSVVRRWERLFTLPHAVLTPMLGMPTHNPHRTVREGDGFMEEVWVNDGRGGGNWKLVQREARNGLYCGVREMQVVRKGEREGDVNWENARIPGGQTLYFPT